MGPTHYPLNPPLTLVLLLRNLFSSQVTRTSNKVKEIGLNMLKKGPAPNSHWYILVLIKVYYDSPWRVCWWEIENIRPWHYIRKADSQISCRAFIYFLWGPPLPHCYVEPEIGLISLMVGILPKQIKIPTIDLKLKRFQISNSVNDKNFHQLGPSGPSWS